MESSNKSLREKLFGPLKALRTKIAEAADTVAEAMPASTVSYTKKGTVGGSAIDTPLLKSNPIRSTPEVKTDDGALVPNRMNERPSIPPNAVKINAEDDVPRGSGQIERIGGSLYHIPNAVKINAEDDVKEGTGQVQRIGSGLYHTPNKGAYTVKDRGISFSQDEVDKVLRPLIFSEVSSTRPTDKQKLEVQTVLNTALNRMTKRKQSFSEVLNSGEYQGISNPQYKNYFKPNNVVEKAHKQKLNSLVDEVMEEIKNGSFQDNITGAEFYAHMKDGTIAAFDTYDELQKAKKEGKLAF